MIGYNNPVLLRQSLEAAEHAPVVPLADNCLQPRPVTSEAFWAARASSKRLRLSGSGSGQHTTAASSNNSSSNIASVSSLERKKRFNRTRDALEKSGLMGITLKTADLLKSNQSLEREIMDLKKETEKLLQAILRNPGNERLREKYANTRRQRSCQV